MSYLGERARWSVELMAVAAIVFVVVVAAANLGVPAPGAVPGAMALVGAALVWVVPKQKWPDARTWGVFAIVGAVIVTGMLIWLSIG